jgi:DNA-binding response OmpR family regulator
MASHIAQKPLLNTRVLVVEDDAFIGKVYLKWLTAAGAHVSLASDGVQGLSQLEREVPDVVLLDLGMPGLNGYDTLKEMRSREQLKRVPVIILTNTMRNEAKDTFESLNEMGASDVLQKYEVSLSQLVEAIRKTLEAHNPLL